MPRPRNTDQRRAQIVEALIQVMAERGYEGASVAAVAKAAGLTAGLVHYHFRTKREILLALVERVGRRRSGIVRERVERARTPSTRLKAFVDAYLALGADADQQELACWVWIGAEAVRDADVAEALQSALLEPQELLTELLADALRAAGRAEREAPKLASAVLAAIQGYCTLAVACPGLVPPGSAAPTLWKLLKGLL